VLALNGQKWLRMSDFLALYNSKLKTASQKLFTLYEDTRFPDFHFYVLLSATPGKPVAQVNYAVPVINIGYQYWNCCASMLVMVCLHACAVHVP